MEPNSLAETSARYARWREGLLALLKVAQAELPQRNAEERLNRLAPAISGSPISLRLPMAPRGRGRQ
jgi:hypothetical protein